MTRPTREALHCPGQPRRRSEQDEDRRRDRDGDRSSHDPEPRPAGHAYQTEPYGHASREQGRDVDAVEQEQEGEQALGELADTHAPSAQRPHGHSCAAKPGGRYQPGGGSASECHVVGVFEAQSPVRTSDHPVEQQHVAGDRGGLERDGNRDQFPARVQGPVDRVDALTATGPEQVRQHACPASARTRASQTRRRGARPTPGAISPISERTPVDGSLRLVERSTRRTLAATTSDYHGAGRCGAVRLPVTPGCQRLRSCQCAGRGRIGRERVRSRPALTAVHRDHAQAGL